MSITPAGIDVAQLEMMTGGDQALAAEALGIFRNQAELWGRLLDPSVEPSQWADAAHSIKGAAKSIGLMELGEACARAEALGRGASVSPAQAGVAIAEVKDRLGEAMEAIAAMEHRLMHGQGFQRAG
jgi:HPt (histidine-containing phosphotransfer) domain-containing protein